MSFSDPGTYEVFLVASGSAGYASDSVIVTVNDTYEAWAQRNGAGLPEEDDDRDGLNNLLEYGLDRDPKVPDGSQFFPGGEYTRYLRKIDLTYSGQFSRDLDTWIGAVEGSLPSADPDTQPWRMQLPGGERWFMRLLIEKN